MMWYFYFKIWWYFVGISRTRSRIARFVGMFGRSASVPPSPSSRCSGPRPGARSRVERYSRRGTVLIIFNSDQNPVKILSKFRKIGRNSAEIRKLVQFSKLSKIFCEIPRKFHQNRCKIRRKLLKNNEILQNVWKFAKKFDDFLLRFSVSRGAKVW